MREMPDARPDVENGVLVVDVLSHERASVVALTVAQSAAMDYYESIVDQMFVTTDKFGDATGKGRHHAHAHAAFAQVHRRHGGHAQRGAFHLAPARQTRRGLGRSRRGSHLRKLRSEFDLVDRYDPWSSSCVPCRTPWKSSPTWHATAGCSCLEATVVLLILFEIVLSLIRH